MTKAGPYIQKEHLVKRDRERTYALRFDFLSSSNSVEYEALIAGLQLAKWLGVDRVIARDEI